MNQKGVTLVELLIVIVVLGVVAMIGTIYVGNIVENTRVEADLANVRTLNRATYNYGLAHQKSEGFFAGLNTDEERMELLVETGFLTNLIHAQSRQGEIYWDVNEEYWLYTLHTVASDATSEHLFQSTDVSAYQTSGNWQSEEEHLHSSFGLLFIENPRDEYTITVTAQLDEGSSGGFGILFDTSLINGSDTGYALQFDRGYGRGSIVIRPRTNGSEGNVIQSHRFDHSNSFIPDKNTVEGEAWWNSVKTIRLEVRIIENVPLTKALSLYIDGVLLFDDFIFQSNTSPSNNFTGLRSWHTGTKYYSLILN